jgi:hypothetical protein
MNEKIFETNNIYIYMFWNLGSGCQVNFYKNRNFTSEYISPCLLPRAQKWTTQTSPNPTPWKKETRNEAREKYTISSVFSTVLPPPLLLSQFLRWCNRTSHKYSIYGFALSRWPKRLQEIGFPIYLVDHVLSSAIMRWFVQCWCR